jgi:peptide/nickel transport system permease protein
MADSTIVDRHDVWWRRLPVVVQLRKSSGWQRAMLITGVVICAVYLIVAIFAPLIAPYGFGQLESASGHNFPRTGAPSAEHLWGTTVGGFDVLSRVIYGAQTAVLVVIVAVVVSIIIGVLVGMISGYLGGWLDRVLVVIADAIFAFPSLLLAIVVSIVVSGGSSSYIGGILSAAISITVVYVPQYFRVIRAEAVRLKNDAFVESARVIGSNPWRIMTRHVLRNSTRSLPLILTLNASDAILTLAGLGFLGFGIGPTAGGEWGYDLSRALSDVASGVWWTGVFPGVAIVVLVLGVTFIGESLNDISDPRLRARRRLKQRIRPAATPDVATEGASA